MDHEEERCSYLDMLKCGIGAGGGGGSSGGGETEEEILGFSSKFLDFGGMYDDDDQVPVLFPMMYQCSAGSGTGTTGQQMSSESSSMSTSLSSSSPTSTAATNSVLSNSSSSSSRQQKKKQENGGRKTEATSVGGGGNNSKKAKTGGGVSQGGTIKVRKEKLGERIMALQQLVSPFGKSDTASVLLEALGYIRFLHEQVQVLSSPYLERLPSCTSLHEGGRSDLRSRGLCLVPVSCTEHVTSSANGADLWSPPSVSNGNGNHPSFSTNH